MEYASTEGCNYNKASYEWYILPMILFSNSAEVFFFNLSEDFLSALEECIARRRKHLS